MNKKVKIILIVSLILLSIFFLFIKPYMNFKSMEKKVLESGKRYYEINNSQLPTGNKIKTIDLKTLYLKDFIESDLKVKITDKKCNLDNSWIKVKKEDIDYNYYIYLECGIFKSKVDHEGPTIKLKGEDEITLYKDEEYKELGIESVVDDTDGKIDIKEVSIDASEVNSSKVGTYEVTYKVKDSFNNETVKIRKVNVIETLNHIVEKDTGKTNIYKGSQYNNYIRLDGILFKIVGINSDNSVKLVTSEAVSAVNYNDVETWLNDYFYEKFSDSAKKYIKKNSKWCIDTVSAPSKYTKCSKYSKEKPVGLLSIIDYNNAKKDSSSNLNIFSMTYNLKDKNTVYKLNNGIYTDQKDSNIMISPSINIVKNASILKGNGTIENPYILKGNNQKLKPGEKISNAVVGSYIYYSGYNFRIIGKEKDDTTMIIMDSIAKLENDEYIIEFDNDQKINFDSTRKNSIAYYLRNKVNSYLKTNIFTNKNRKILDYMNQIGYDNDTKDKNYNGKIFLPSMYDLFSTTIKDDYWYMNHSSKSNLVCYMHYSGNVFCSEKNNDKKGVRVVAYLDKNATIKLGSGVWDDPYVLAK